MGIEKSCLSDFPALFSLLENKQGSSPRLWLERLATLPLTKRTILLICLVTPEPHIRVLWEVQYLIPDFTCTTPEDGEVLAFARYVHLGIIPNNMEVNP